MSGPSPGPTDGARLRALAGGIGVELSEAAADRLLAYLDGMLEINRQVNLTAIRDRESAVVLHALDGLAAGLSTAAGMPEPARLLDIGSGNGFPGVACAALWPDAQVVLMDRTAKKMRAVGSVLRELDWAGIRTVHMDAAQAAGLEPDWEAGFEVVTARAVTRPEPVGVLAAPLAEPGGSLLLWLDADADAPATLARKGWLLEDVLDYALPDPAARQRRLARYQRID